MLLKSHELFGTPKNFIMDPVHGGIPYFDHEKKIVNHPLFQRLRHIKQNDVLNLVFPGATHTRFEHSIGTMHVAGLILKNMLRSHFMMNSEIGNFPFKKEFVEGVQYFYGCLRLAALLHDVGHMPFSHQFEKAEGIMAILQNEKIKNKLMGEDTDPGSCVTHEHLSLFIAKKILQEICPSRFEAKDVIALIKKSKEKPSLKFQRHAKCVTNALLNSRGKKTFKQENWEISKLIVGLLGNIISGEVDADKMDYLLRDSYFTGAHYGDFSLDHLVRNICLGYDPVTQWLGVALNEKGLGAFEDFVHARFRMYMHVYNHKTAVGFKYRLTKAINEVVNKKGTRVRGEIVKAINSISQLDNITDSYLWEAFRKYAKGNKDSNCNSLLKRKSLIHVDKIVNGAQFEIQGIKRKLKEKRVKEVIDFEAESKFSKIMPSYENIRVLLQIRTGNKKQRELKSICSLSNFFEKFSRQQVVHFFSET